MSAASGQKNGQFNRERNYIFVINDVVSHEGSKVMDIPQIAPCPQLGFSTRLCLVCSLMALSLNHQ